MYLSKLKNLLVPISKYIFTNFKMYFAVEQFRTCLANGPSHHLSKCSKYTCPNFKMYLSKFLNVLVQILKCIRPNV